MSAPEPPRVDCERQQPAFHAGDVAAAAAFYTGKLGFTLGFTWGDPPNPAGCSVYFAIEDADELYEFQRANGVEVEHPPGDRPWGLRDYTVRDLNGYRLTFGHYLPATEPPLPIERVHVPVRVEKRLAALMLLHSFEPVGDGEAVASPHTRRTLRCIRELKRKHAIDYDCHASYRFHEE